MSDRKRWVPSDQAKNLLETIFTADSFPTFSVRTQLAHQLGIDARQVQIWFQNRRQRERLLAGKRSAGSGALMDDTNTGADGGDNFGRLEGGSSGDCGSTEGIAPDGTLAQIVDNIAATAVTVVGSSRDSAMKKVIHPGSDRMTRSHTHSVDMLHACDIERCMLPPPPRVPWSLPAEAAAEVETTNGSRDATGGCSGNVSSQLPSNAPPALYAMLETPGGPRALAAAARSLLLNNPILQHPGAPCHALLTHLAATVPNANFGTCATSASVTCTTCDAGSACMPTPNRCRSASIDSGDHVGCAPSDSSLLGKRPRMVSDRAYGGAYGGYDPPSLLRREVSSEAVEVLSSQFFTGSGTAPWQAFPGYSISLGRQQASRYGACAEATSNPTPVSKLECGPQAHPSKQEDGPP